MQWSAEIQLNSDFDGIDLEEYPPGERAFYQIDTLVYQLEI